MSQDHAGALEFDRLLPQEEVASVRCETCHGEWLEGFSHACRIDPREFAAMRSAVADMSKIIKRVVDQFDRYGVERERMMRIEEAVSKLERSNREDPSK